MKTIRRLYFFLVAFISVEVVLWGLIELLRQMVFRGVLLEPATLAQALSLILVGVPIFLIHWGWAQHAARSDAEEHAALLRAVFLYAVLLATLVPVAQNVLALLNRSFITLAGLESYRAFLGGAQSWTDNLIAIFFNLVAAAYFYRVTQFDWLTLLDSSNYRDVRRFYRYIWVLYGLLLLVFGVQQVLSFLFSVPFAAVSGQAKSEDLMNGLALLLVGAPIWFFAWQTCQRALAEPQETGSSLRLGILYLLSLGGVVTVLSAAGIVADAFLRLLLGEPASFAETMAIVRGPLSVGLPLAAIWAYYGHTLSLEIASYSSPVRRAGLKRFYFYVLSLIGLGATFTGLALLFGFFVEQLTTQRVWGIDVRRQLSAALAVLLVSLPLWLLTWRPMQAESLTKDENGDNARRSLIRRAYLYLVIFSTVLGGMGSAIALFYLLLSALLGSPGATFLRDALNALQLLVLFVVFLVYHWSALRRDAGRKADALAALQAQFPVLVFEQAGSGFAALVQAAIQQTTPLIQAAAVSVEQGIPEGAEAARAVILPSTLAFNPPEALRVWLKDYDGHKIIVPLETPGWYWPGGFPRNGVTIAAQMVRQLSEGQEVRVSTGISVLQGVAYVFAILFGIQLLFALLIFGIALVSM